MPQAVEAACREELRRAGLSGQGGLLRLLTLLRTAPETHLGLAEVLRMAAEAGFNTTHADLARQLETLADHGLLVRLFSTAAEPVFDTVTEPHSHLVYDETAQIVDLHVSSGTLLEILRQALADRPDEVEILVRFRRTAGRSGRGPFRAVIQCLHTAKAAPMPVPAGVRRSGS
ncbi:transcriptional repressor [Acidisphaera sp. S103]|uniref:transcriptional repressor n=1 Tax=Acidisphaera sp. S103 TaxID=1747223 RepID=UPI00131BDD61|nr:transcriptional repressor [Acidisphaera sp. S103]